MSSLWQSKVLRLHSIKVSKTFVSFHVLECLSTDSVCPTCSEIGHKFPETSLQACNNCLQDGKRCVKLIVLIWASDCEENNKKAMQMLSNFADKGELNISYQNISFCPESVHVGKCFKSSFANWFLYKSGERFNLSNIRVLFSDTNPEVKKNVRETITLSAVRNRDRMSVEDLLLLLQPELQKAISKVPRIVQTIVLEPFHLYKETPVVCSNTQLVCALRRME